MDGADQAWTTSITCIAVCDAPRRVLFTDSEGRLMLPRIEFAAGGIENSLAIAYFRQKFGRDVRVLRPLHERHDDAERRTDVLLHLEDIGPAPTTLCASRWIPVEELPESFGVPNALAELIREAIAESELGVASPLRRPWARPGWHARAEEWMRATAAANGYRVTGPTEDLRTWAISRLLRLPTDRGYLYFKASGGSRLFCKEAQVTEGLARRFPSHVPRPIAIEPNEGWMLTPDFGDPLGDHCATAQRTAALRQFATLQVEASASVGELLALGCVDRRLPILAGQIRQLLTTIAPSAGLSDMEMARLQSSGPPLEALCARLATYRVPPTLMHGDLHLNNIAMREPAATPTFLFFDWTDACISHPFLDLIAIKPKMDGGERVALTTAFLEPWTAFEPMPRLREMVVMAIPLVAMHQAVSYRAIDDASDAPFMYRDQPALAVWLREALDALPAACRIAGLVH